MLMGDKPYFISVGGASEFEVHRHPEIEISFCMDGEYDVICEHKRYTLSAGEFIVIPPMMAHELPKRDCDCKKLTIEVGSIMLGEFYEPFTKLGDVYPFKNDKSLVALFYDTAELYYSDAFNRELVIKSNLYKICAILLQLLSLVKTDDSQSKRTSDIKKIDKALEMIYNRYHEPLTVESVSAYCGYSKSNFCKIFKNVTGSTFHHTLNRHRVEIACVLLRESDRTVEEIARDTGFADTKSFCRVFKSFMKVNAGAYRKL